MRFLLLWLLLLATNLSIASTTTPIQYHFTPTDAAHHLAHVSITFPNVTSKTFQVKLPVWRSGRYEILDLSKAVSSFYAQDLHGQAIQWEKSDKNSWKLFLNHPGPVTIGYQIYANTLKQRVIHIDSTHAFLDASGVFMFSPAFRDHPLTVSLDVPNHWQSRSGMEKSSSHQFVADNYDQLVDSPIETGVHEFLSFQLDQQNYEIVIWGEGNHDIADIKTKVSLLHHEAKKIWETFPYKRYVYIFHAGDQLRGATEHVNSTIIQQNRFNFKPRKPYLKVLSTTAHELIHTWNVKAYRPAGIAPYDYSKENYSDLFWMAEGITSYYDDLFLLRAGIFKPKEYFAQMAEHMKNHLDNPGRKVESLAQSSFDTWLKDDAQQSHNAAVSIYLEGNMVAWRLDQEIRSLTDNQYGLDQLQKLLYQRHHNTNQGYHKQDVLNLLEEITGHNMNAFWQAYVEGTQAIDFDQLLFFYGLQKTPKEPSADAAWIGANLNIEGEFVGIKTVDSDSPAWHAGLTMGDQLLSINGIKLSPDNVKIRLKQLTIGTSYEIHYFSAGRLRTTTITPVDTPNPDFFIEPVDKPDRQQKARFKSWAGQDLVPRKK
ncbi:M61 family metallopeptidase [Marinicella litoralis]|uniref:Putative metalloprotease with PDZ domain n=1 Tax=Marinicella litoralis TaxID=644220 RepID=A0A4R6XM71_9GAMM|nr:PDZ domain-containing protein [Marinicella litoralis]TDR20752.1 putative metalloprotease with PDZ domain [Marinicella litoralis]